MSWFHLLFGFSGRLNRTGFWIGIIVLGFGFGLAGEYLYSYKIIYSIVVVLRFYVYMALLAKRFHDTGQKLPAFARLFFWIITLIRIMITAYFEAGSIWINKYGLPGTVASEPFKLKPKVLADARWKATRKEIDSFGSIAPELRWLVASLGVFCGKSSVRMDAKRKVFDSQMSTLDQESLDEAQTLFEVARIMNIPFSFTLQGFMYHSAATKNSIYKVFHMFEALARTDTPANPERQRMLLYAAKKFEIPMLDIETLQEQG